MRSSILLIIAILFSLQSCDYERVNASGEVTTVEHIFTDFTGIDISSDFKAFITITESEESISIEADDNLHEHIVVELNGTILEIRLKNNTCIKGNETLNAYISSDMLTSFEASGDSEIFLENELQAEDVTIELSGDSKFDGLLTVTDLDVELRGDSKILLVGSTDKLEATAKGDSKIENFGFSVNKLEIDLSGDSEAYLTVHETIDISASGDSKLFYKGDASIVRQNLSGDSEIVNLD